MRGSMQVTILRFSALELDGWWRILTDDHIFEDAPVGLVKTGSILFVRFDKIRGAHSVR